MKTVNEYYGKLHEYREAELLLSAIRLNVFSVLSEFKSPLETARELDCNPRNMDLFLRSLVSIGLLELKEEKYRNTDSTDKYLNRNSADYIGDGILFRKEMMSLENLENLVKHGPGTVSSEQTDGVAYFDFYKLAEVTRPEMYFGRVQDILRLTGALFGDDKPFKVLDLGGGSGTLAFEIGKAYAGSEVVVFEHPNVAGLPRQLIVEEGLTHKASVIEGDFNKDDIGSGYDLIIASGVMDFAHYHMDSVSEKLYESLNDGGYFYVITHGVSEDFVAPKGSIIGWLGSRLNGSDILTTEKTILQGLMSAGFKRTENVHKQEGGHLKTYLFRK